MRDTKTSYATTTAAYNYTAANILNLPVAIQIYDGAGNLYGLTQYTYDEYSSPATPLYNCPGILGHDNANFAGGAARGNATTVGQWLTGSTWFNTKQSYDIAGNLINVTDANQHTTWFSYNDNYADGQNRNSYGFVTGVTNALGQSPFQAQYDFSTGQTTVTADLMGQYTTYNYSGTGYGIDRVSQVNYANGGHTYYSFLSANQTVIQQDQNSGDAALKQQTLYDGFGRAVETDVFEGGSQTIATAQSYDALGRVATVTNPYRSTGDATYGVTSYSYDGLGRVTQVTTSDGAVATTGYAGNQITSTDAAGHMRQTTVDALGRLAKVVEDPNGLNYATTYTFGANNTLQKVAQGSQTRLFQYDSLKRLQTATNPESGTVSYTYDNVGNVLTRTDNRGVTTSYVYDALNRVTQVSYSDGTPAVSYGYDAANVANSRGHLTSVSNGNSTTNYTNFDTVGNVLASSQVTAGRTYSFAYGYNAAGALSSETYPSGRAVTTGYDGANRVNAVNGTLGGQTKPYAYSISYAPHGGLSSLGEGNNVAPVWTYNNRFQVNAYYASISGDPNHYLLYGALWYGTTNNNGSLYNASEAYGNSVPWSSLSWLYQSYSYDHVNRLTGVSDTGYSRTFGYL